MRNKIIICCALCVLFIVLFIMLVLLFEKLLLKCYHKKVDQLKLDVKSRKRVLIALYIALYYSMNSRRSDLKFSLIKSEIERGFSENDMKKVEDSVNEMWYFLKDVAKNKKILESEFWVIDTEFDEAWNISDVLTYRYQILTAILLLFAFIFFGIIIYIICLK